MNYQKYYSNQIHSSSLLCQLAQLWKTQTLCDAVIKTGNINTKAHRLVLVAACPMLQSMDNAAIGSHLEVRLASEIKQESVNTFLQYLYEGFFLLTEDNCRDIEKIARLLQVDSVIKCCADFFKNLQEKTGLPVYNSGQYKYTTYDMLEFRHMRVSGMQKSMHETANKRASEFQPHSPSNKRQRTHRPGSPSNDSHYSSDGHRSSQSSELWDRVPRLGLGMSSHGATGRKVQPGVIEIMEDSLELVNTEPVEKDSYGRPIDSRPPVQKSVSISVASKVTGGDPELQIIDVGSQGRPSQTATSSSRPHPRISTDNQNNMYLSTSSPSSRSDIPSGSSTQNTADATNLPSPRTEHQRQSAAERQSNSQFSGLDLDFTKPKPVVPVEMHASPMVNTGNRISSSSSSYSPSVQSQPKPFAAGSASQGSMSTPSNIPSSSPSNLPSSQSESTPMPELSLFGMNASQSGKSSRPQPGPSSRSDSLERSMSAERPKVESGTPGSNTPEGMAPDISIVKIESTVKDGETGGLDMFVDAPDDGGTHHPQGMDEMGEQYEGSDYDVEEPPGELEGSNEGSNLSGDQNNSWYMNTMKGIGKKFQIGAGQSQNLGTQPGVPPLSRYPMEANQYKGDIFALSEYLQKSGHTSASEAVDSDVMPGSGHLLIPDRGSTNSTNRPCAYCKMKGFRTSTGLPIKTYWKCQACQVPLCRPRTRQCFREYHQLVLELKNKDKDEEFEGHMSPPKTASSDSMLE